MKNSNTAFLTTIFPASKLFLKDFFNSLKSQTCKDFDIIVINDGVSEFEDIKEQYTTLNIIEIKVNYSPSKNREFGINKVLEFGYNNIIFGDSDDFFEQNRIEIISDLLESNHIVINNLNIFKCDRTKYKFFNNIENQKLDVTFFLKRNIAGLSNTGIRTSLLKKKVSLNRELIAIDWYFFTKLLLQNPNAKVLFTNKTSTYYRQYEQNTIGINEDVNNEKIILGIKVKLIQYESLINFCKENKLTKFVEIFETEHLEIKFVEEKLKDIIFFNHYISIIKQNFNNIFKGWWSEILTLKEFAQYEN